MDPQRQRIQEDLRGVISGQVRCDEAMLELYGSDASIYQIRPLAVVVPQTLDDVVACVQYAAEHGVPIHARGAGSGLAGGCLGPGIVVDFSRYLRRILAQGEDWITVQAGLVHEQLNAHLRTQGRLFGPDPATSRVTTLGGTVAVNGSGSHWLLYGATRDHVQHVQMVLATGEVVDLRPVSVEDVRACRLPEALDRIARGVLQLLEENASLVQAHQPRTKVNACGYLLDGVLEGDTLHLPRLVVGSEGTLGLFTQITVGTVPLKHHRGVALAFFDSLEQAVTAALELLHLGPSACDLVDRRHLNLARETDPRYLGLIPRSAEAVLLVEFQDDSPQQVRDQLQLLAERLRRRRVRAMDVRLALDPEEVELFWNLALRVVPTLYRVRGQRRAVPVVEDVAVPPERLTEFLGRLQRVLKETETVASLFGHVAQGQLHLRPFLDLADPRDRRRMKQLAARLYEQVLDVGGTISGEHGDGLSRSGFVKLQYGPLYPVMRRIKRLFDPQNIFNPGKIITESESPAVDRLRAVELAVGDSAEQGADGAPQPELNWSLESVLAEARRCNGCAACRVQSAPQRMCPIFRFAPAEEASPRAKATLMRAILTGQLPPEAMASEEFKQVADLCINCQMCRLECPAEVDIPRLMIEAKAAYVRTNGLQGVQWLLTRLDLVGRLGTRFPRLFNWALGTRWTRWAIEKFWGLAQGRKLPRFARGPFLKKAARRRLTRPTRRSGRKVLFFVDYYANYHDVELAEALVAVLEHNGVAVYVPPEQTYSGMAMVAQGVLDAARAQAEHNVRLLAEAVRQGYTIVTTEPSAALCLVREYPALLDDEDARLVAAHTVEACTYLWRLHLAGQLQLDFRPLHVTLAYHAPCHLIALEVGTPGLNLLRLIPGVTVRHLEEGCSGMAGTFGLARANFRRSLRAGWGLITAIRRQEVQAGTTECSACKMQMEQGTTKPTVHPIKLLALGYGLMPQLDRLLTTRSEELFVS